MKNKVERWKELSRETVFHKYGRGIEKVMYRLPDGSESDFYIKTEGIAICTLAITKDKKVILAKQFRPGPNEIILELPGGAAEKGETPEQSAARELLEETGYQGRIELVAANILDCAYSTLKRYCFVAIDCEKICDPKNTRTEITEIVLLTLPEFREFLRSGQLSDIEVGYLGLDYLGLL